MSVLPKELLRKISPDTVDFSELSQSAEIPDERFRKLLQVQRTDEKCDDSDIFSLIANEEEDELAANDLDGQPACIAPPHPLLAHTPIEQIKGKRGASESQCIPLEPVDQKKEKGMSCEAPCAPAAFLRACDPAPFTATQRAAALSPEIEAAFEKMASTMIVMSSSHEVETTLFLDNPQFASSILFGMQITIREFSTAPKAFNIEISANPHAVAAMEASRGDLLAAFENANLNFTVHRFDTHIQQSEDRPVFHRKENNDQDQQDQKGGRGQ